jgi:ubiquinone/menaquinone biosynthesis C-methylase UbiE
MATREDYKQAAIDQWTADPCGASEVDSAPGTREYFERLLAARADYAPWMADAVDYRGSAGLDVLDVGCGQGIDVAQYAMAGATSTGVDLTPRHVDLARAHLAAMGLNANIVRGDAETLPFPDTSFDRVSSNGVLHHTPDLPAALAEIRRVLRPGGESRIIVYNRSSLHYWLQQVVWQGIVERQLLEERSMAGVLSRGVEVSSVGARPLVRVYSPRQMRRLLTSAGFTSVATTVRHFDAGDTFLTAALARRWSALRRDDVLNRIGRVAGWYVVAAGMRAPAS